MGIGDLDGDLDLAVTNDGSHPDYGTVSVLLNHGNGTFPDNVLYGAGIFFPRSVALGDLDGDGNGDCGWSPTGRG